MCDCHNDEWCEECHDLEWCEECHDLQFPESFECDGHPSESGVTQYCDGTCKINRYVARDPKGISEPEEMRC